MREWVGTKDHFPINDCSCLVIEAGQKYVSVLTWNSHYKCWDGADGDDYYCDAEKVSHWMCFPPPPEEL